MINVIGCGSILRRDDGAGIYVLRELGKIALPDDVQLIEAATICLDLLPHWENADKVIVVDAVKSGNRPGTIYRIPAETMKPLAASKLSLHNFNLADGLAFIRTAMGEESVTRTVIFGVEVKNTDVGIGLSSKVKRAIPILVDNIKKEIGLR